MPSPARSVSTSYPWTQLSLSMYKTRYAPVLLRLRRHRLVFQYCVMTGYKSLNRQGWEGFYSCHNFDMTTLNSVPMTWSFSTMSDADLQRQNSKISLFIDPNSPFTGIKKMYHRALTLQTESISRYFIDKSPNSIGRINVWGLRRVNSLRP